MENTFTSYTSDRGLVARLYRELKTLNIRKINNSISKQGEEQDRESLKEELQKAGKYSEECATCFTIMRMQSRSAWGFHLTPARRAECGENNKC